jgi:hypothetical protein
VAWCTNDWVIKLTETIPDSILTKYYKWIILNH